MINTGLRGGACPKKRRAHPPANYRRLLGFGLSRLLVGHRTSTFTTAARLFFVHAFAAGVSVLTLRFFLQQDISALQQSFMSQQAADLLLF